ncbi:uncharacterized protein V6R79_005847 [Siganus canaliculatus]
MFKLDTLALARARWHGDGTPTERRRNADGTLTDGGAERNSSCKFPSVCLEAA